MRDIDSIIEDLKDKASKSPKVKMDKDIVNEIITKFVHRYSNTPVLYLEWLMEDLCKHPENIKARISDVTLGFMEICPGVEFEKVAEIATKLINKKNNLPNYFYYKDIADNLVIPYDRLNLELLQDYVEPLAGEMFIVDKERYLMELAAHHKFEDIDRFKRYKCQPCIHPKDIILYHFEKKRENFAKKYAAPAINPTASTASSPRQSAASSPFSMPNVPTTSSPIDDNKIVMHIRRKYRDINVDKLKTLLTQVKADKPNASADELESLLLGMCASPLYSNALFEQSSSTPVQSNPTSKPTAPSINNTVNIQASSVDDDKVVQHFVQKYPNVHVHNLKLFIQWFKSENPQDSTESCIEHLDPLIPSDFFSSDLLIPTNPYAPRPKDLTAEELASKVKAMFAMMKMMGLGR